MSGCFTPQPGQNDPPANVPAQRGQIFIMGPEGWAGRGRRSIEGRRAIEGRTAVRAGPSWIIFSGMTNSYGSRGTLALGGKNYDIYRLQALDKAGTSTQRLPFSLKVLLENLLRTEDGRVVKADDIAALANWDPKAEPSREIAFTPSRVLLQDFTGVPCVVDLAAMRDAMGKFGGDASRINPLQPVELVIDHSVQVDEFGTESAIHKNAELEFRRNRERYAFLRWGQSAFSNFKVVPPDTGIVHQVNLEYLARVVFAAAAAGKNPALYLDTLVGTDSHTTMVNGLGVLGWGVGGIEAEAAMLGQPVSMLIPRVVGFKLSGELREGSTATDLVLVVTQMLRKKGSSENSSSSTDRDSADCRSPTARRSRTWPPNTARRAASFRSTPKPFATFASPAGPPSRSRSSRRTAASRGSFTPSRVRKRPTRTRSSSISAPSSRVLRVPSGLRIG